MLLLKILFLSSCLLLSQITMANLFTIEVTDYGNLSGDPTVRQEIDNVFLDLQNSVNNELPSADSSNYLTGMYNASVMSMKGLGTDYASYPSTLITGATLGLGLDVGNNTLGNVVGGDVNTNQINGVGFQVSFMFGLNLSNFGRSNFLKNSNILINFMSLDTPKFDSNVEGKLTNAGIHYQYTFGREDKRKLGLVSWGGVTLTTGFEYTSTKLEFSTPITTTATRNFPVNSPPPAVGATTVEAEAQFNGTVDVGADITVYSVPLELSTSLTFFYFLSLYGGVGVDYNSGSSTAIAQLSGTMTLQETQSEAPVLGTVSSLATLDVGSEGKPDQFLKRYFFGTQFNILYFKYFFQVNKALDTGLWSIITGLKFSY